MVKEKVFIPATGLGISALIIFYLLCAVKSFIFFLIVFAAGVCSMSCVFLFCCGKTARVKNRRFFISCSAGFFAALFAYCRLCADSVPVKTLADLSAAEEIFVCLKSDAMPAGRAYYKAKAAVFSCRLKDGAEFSVKGDIDLFIPSVFVAQNNSGSITVFPSSKTDCRLFAKGVCLSAEGRFSGEKKYFENSSFFVSKTSAPQFSYWKNTLSAFRGYLRFCLMRLLYAWKDAGGLLFALLSANRDFLIAECASAFKNAGQYHVLALSGMHLSIAVLSVSFVAKLFSKKKSAPLFSVLFAFAFIYFAGASPSLLRAFGMMLIITLGISLNIKPDVFAVMCAVCTLHLIFKPADALTLGFMLSYGALAGILIFGKAFCDYFRGLVPPKILNGLAASAGAVFFTAPIVILKTGSIALIGVIATFFVSPLVSVFLILGIIFIPLAVCFPFLTGVFGEILNMIYRVIFLIVDFFARFPLITPNFFLSKLVLCVIFPLIGIVFIFKAVSREKKAAVKLP